MLSEAKASGLSDRALPADACSQDTIQGSLIPAYMLLAAGNDKGRIAPHSVAHRLEEAFKGLGVNELDANGVPVAMGQLDEPG